VTARPDARHIEVEVGGARARAILHDREAPVTAEALWEALPIEGDLLQSRWSGETTFAVVDALRRPDLPLENRATFMCPGTIHVGATKGNLGIPYGQAQSRDLGGDNTWGTVVASFVGDAEPLLAVLRTLVETGATPVRLTRAESA
jgi:Protein of unknown function (DUF3830)